MQIKPLLSYFLINMTLHMSSKKYIFTYLNQYSPRKNSKVSMGQPYPYSTIWKKNIMLILHIYWTRTIFYYFVITQTLKLINVAYILAYLGQYSPRKIIKGSTRQLYPYSKILGGISKTRKSQFLANYCT